MPLFQSNLRKQIRNLPKILNFVKKIHYYSELFTSLLGPRPSRRAPPPVSPCRVLRATTCVASALRRSASWWASRPRPTRSTRPSWSRCARREHRARAASAQPCRRQTPTPARDRNSPLCFRRLRRRLLCLGLHRRRCRRYMRAHQLGHDYPILHPQCLHDYNLIVFFLR